MEKLLPILAVLILGTAGWAQVTHQDYQAWRRAERNPYASLDDAAPLQAAAPDLSRLAVARNDYRGRHADVYDTRSVFDTRTVVARNNYRGRDADVYDGGFSAALSDDAYHAWRRAEQEVYRTAVVRGWHPAILGIRP